MNHNLKYKYTESPILLFIKQAKRDRNSRRFKPNGEFDLLLQLQ